MMKDQDKSQLVPEQDSNSTITDTVIKEARLETNRLYIEKRKTDVAIIEAQDQVAQLTLFLAQVEAKKAAADKAVSDGAEALADLLLGENSSWNKGYKQLLKYKETHGNCNVECSLICPPETALNTENNELERWIQQVRLQALTPEGPEHLEPYMIYALNTLGFDWQTTESIWLQQYLNLKTYMKTHGRGKIPNMRKDTLGVWCAEQIIAYNKFQSEKASSMNMKKVILMNGIGFVWDTRPSIWMQRYTTLHEFNEKNGHCRVPANFKNQTLFRWVVRERKKYRNFLENKSPTQTDEQRILMDNLHFVNSLVPTQRNRIRQNICNDDASDNIHDAATNITEDSSSMDEELGYHD